MRVISVGSISARIACLIESHDGGDREATGRRLSIAPDRLNGLLSGDWRRFSLDALARVIEGYGISIDELFAFARTEDSSWPSPRRFCPTSSSSTLPNSPGGS